jgi:sterol desaturase/sphingolipid hydroxylase (fatty acid hydroxylase superfamily)
MLLLAVVGVALVLAAVERIPGLRLRVSPWLRPALASDVFYFVTGIGFSMLTGGFVWWASARLAELGVPRLAELELPVAAAFVLALVVLDLGQYACHRLLHAVGPLWKVHKVHHSSPTLDWLANSRSHVIENALRRMVGPIGIILLGAPVLPTAIAGVVLSSWGVFIHSNLRLDAARVLEPVLVTPRLHRIHHVPATTQRNFGSFFSIWDRLIPRAFVSVDVPPDAVLGIPDETDTYPQTFFRQLIEPFRRR